jgi:hypothetical protein
VLRRYTRRIPDLDAALWNLARTALGEQRCSSTMPSSAVTHELDTELKGGERTLLGG